MGNHSTIRVLIVDDSAFMRTVITEMLSAAPDIEVVGSAGDGKQGLVMARDLTPDVITLDVEMPILSGIEMLPILMSTHPTPVIMLSSLTKEGADVTLEALSLGAVDFMPKNLEGGPLGMRKVGPQLVEKVRAVGTGNTRAALTRRNTGTQTGFVSAPAAAPREHTATGEMPVVAIGCSTGGPAALSEVIPALPGNLNAAVVVVQHMPAGFTRVLAERLDRLSRVSVKEAEDGETLRPGVVLVAPGGHHLMVERTQNGLVARLSDTPQTSIMPAVDILFESLAKACPRETLGMVLTGMGTDGRDGSRTLAGKGGTIVAQCATGCLVYGMPKAVVDSGIARRVVELPHIADHISRHTVEADGSKVGIG